MTTSRLIAKSLLDIKAVGFSPQKPITFKSGIISPVYVDNRRLPFYPSIWSIVLRGFVKLIKTKKLNFHIVAGIESAGIPHSSALGFVLKKPSVFTRKEKKGHGTKKMVEGGDVKNKRVLLIEDHITTGGSSLLGVKSLRSQGAIVTDCLAITSYNFPEAGKKFSQSRVKLHTLTSFNEILKEAVSRKLIDSKIQTSIKNWMGDPYGWGKTNATQ